MQHLKILILCTYDPAERSHGGQIRVFEMIRYLKNAGHQVRCGGVLTNKKVPPPAGFINLDEAPHIHGDFGNWFLMDDALISILSKSNDRYVDEIYSSTGFVPDVIISEQPWCFNIAIRYREKYAQRSILIYGSANVEHRLKKSILEKYFPDAHTEAAVKIVQEIEEYAIQKSDINLAVTESDAIYIRNLQPEKHLVLARNGTSSKKPLDVALMAKFSNFRIPSTKYAIFCASAHPPNVFGFFKYLSGPNASLVAERSLVIVGSSGKAIQSDSRYEDDIYFKSRIIFTGVVDSELIPALVCHAHVNLLPIDDGEGSNLKAAEALTSGAYIVATSKALRGFEFAKNLSHVFIADDPLEFKKAIRAAFSLPPCKLEQQLRDDILSKISWESCFAGLGKSLSTYPIS